MIKKIVIKYLCEINKISQKNQYKKNTFNYYEQYTYMHKIISHYGEEKCLDQVQKTILMAIHLRIT